MKEYNDGEGASHFESATHLHLATLVTAATKTLTQAEVSTPRLDAELLLAHLLGVNRAYLYAHPERELARVMVDEYKRLVARRAAREPLPYILGHWEFYGLDFIVNEHVLIPRPETELLVEHALRVGARFDRAPIIADIGTGSGAIAVTLAVHLPAARLYAVDVSAEALAVAARNCERHGVADRVWLLQGDLLAPLPEPVDIIVANLPYIARGEWTSLSPEVGIHEPRRALDGGADGLEVIKRLLAAAPAHLNSRAYIMLEIGAAQGEAVRALARESLRDVEVEVVADYAGWERGVIIKRANT